MSAEPRPDGGNAPRDTGSASAPVEKNGHAKVDPRGDHITNGAEATNLPTDSDLQPLTPDTPDPKIEQARQDLASGQVDTDLREKPGLDAERRGQLVPGGERKAGSRGGER
jgi:hypothetical protein